MAAAPVAPRWGDGIKAILGKKRERRIGTLTFLAFLAFVRIEDQFRGNIPFERWPHLERIAAQLQNGESLVILKARRLGISWLIIAYAVFLAVTRPHSAVLVISKVEDDAKEMIRRAKFIINNLPPGLRLPYRTSNTSEVELEGGGRILALPSTENAGRSLGATLVITDEAAFHAYATANYTAYKPTIDGGGQLVMVSTSAGPSGLFYLLYQQARRGLASMRSVFIPWWFRAHRALKGPDGQPLLDENGDYQPDYEWLKQELANFPGSAAEARREYPTNEREAWATATGLVYGIDEVDGVLIFSPDAFDPRDVTRLPTAAPIGGNIAPDPCAFEDCKWHYAAVDWGGGDPTAVGIYGVTSSGRIHKYAEMHRTGPVAITEISDFLSQWDPNKYLFDRIVCGADEGTSIASLAWIGWPAVAADTRREEGLRTQARLLKQRRFTYNLERCPETISQFDSYFWNRSRDPRTGEKYDTKTPSKHHGDHMDCDRYLAMEVEGREERTVPGGLPDFELKL